MPAERLPMRKVREVQPEVPLRGERAGDSSNAGGAAARRSGSTSGARR